jgi:acetylornithine/succinyldiaminopimelate/putrescine aminotransferase
MGALSINGVTGLKTPFEPLVPDTVHVRNTNRYHRPEGETEAEFTAFLLEDLEETIEQAGPETVAMVIMEPVQNAGGSFTPPEGYFAGVREICDRHGILLCADEVITGFGRVGAWFASERYDIRPDLILSAKGLSSAYASIGAVIARDAVMEPFLEGSAMYAHGITFGGHPVQAAIALKNIEIMKREKIVEHVAEEGDTFRSTLSQLLDLPIAGDLRGTGFFYALELVKDKETKETFSEEECEELLRGFLSPRLFEAGLICRADDRGDPVVQISPPLVARQAEFDQIAGILGDALAEAWTRLDGRAASGRSAPTAARVARGSCERLTIDSRRLASDRFPQSNEPKEGAHAQKPSRPHDAPARAPRARRFGMSAFRRRRRRRRRWSGSGRNGYRNRNGHRRRWGRRRRRPRAGARTRKRQLRRQRSGAGIRRRHRGR